jgi:hypothetical protein
MIGGLKRLCGTFTEASYFSTYTLGLFAASFSFFRSGMRSVFSGTVALILFLLLILSTSTTAYVGLFLYFLWLWFSGMFGGRQKKKASPVAILAAIMLIVFVGVFAVYMADRIVDLFDKLILSKADTDSGVNRGKWNTIALNSVVDSFGIGIGIGSTRSSSFAITLLSNAGVLGAILYSRFVYKAISCRRAALDPSFNDRRTSFMALREGIIGNLIGACLSSVVFDLGLWIYMMMGMAAALAPSPPKIKKQPLFGYVSKNATS